jgi:hypothetical protein
MLDCKRMNEKENLLDIRIIILVLSSFQGIFESTDRTYVVNAEAVAKRQREAIAPDENFIVMNEDKD